MHRYEITRFLIASSRPYALSWLPDACRGEVSSSYGGEKSVISPKFWCRGVLGCWEGSFNNGCAAIQCLVGSMLTRALFADTICK